MKQKPIQHVIQISNQDASKNVGIMMLDLPDEAEALELARKIALATGRRVTLRDARLALIETIPAARVH